MTIHPTGWSSELYFQMQAEFADQEEFKVWFDDADINTKIKYLQSTFREASKYLDTGQPRSEVRLYREAFLPILAYSGFLETFDFLQSYLEDERIENLFLIQLVTTGEKIFQLTINEDEFDKKIQTRTPLLPVRQVTGQQFPEIPLKTNAPTLRFQIPLKPVCFFGRKNELNSLASFFTKQDPSAKTLLLTAIGGMGKTSVMQKFLHDERCKGFFERIIYIVVNHNLRQSFLFKTAQALELTNAVLTRAGEEAQLDFLTAEMSRLTGENLFVVDNINEADFNELLSLKRFFDSSGWRFLVTSRVKPAGYIFEEINELSIEDAKLLFTYHFRPELVDRDDQDATYKNLKEALKSATNNSDLEELLKHIANHTLLTELLAKVGFKKGFSIREIYDRLLKQDYAHPDFKREVEVGEHGKGRNVLSTARLDLYILGLFDTDYLFEKSVNAETDIENNEKAIILLFFSMLPPDDLPQEDLLILFDIKESQVNQFQERLDELRQMGWLQHKFARDEKTLKTHVTYKMHMLVQKVVNQKLTDKLKNSERLVASLTGIIKNRHPDPVRFQKYSAAVFKWYEENS